MIIGKEVQHKLLKSTYGQTITVNGRYKCTFNQQNDISKNSLFSDFKKDLNCPRFQARANVAVYDMLTSKDLDGMIALSIDRDLAHRYTTTLYTRGIGEDSWKMGTMAVNIDGLDSKQ